MADNQANDPKPQTMTSMLRTVSKQIDDSMNLLRNQQQLLLQRGVNLPSGAIDSLKTVKKRLQGLERGMSENQKELRSLRTLANTTALINSSQKTDEVLNQVMDEVVSLTGAERGYIMLKNPNTGELEFRVARGINQSDLDGKSGMVISRTIVNKVAETGEPVLTDNASGETEWQNANSIVGFNLRSILAVPLKTNDNVIGVVYCDNSLLQGLFTNSEMDVLNAFGNQAAVALENARLFEVTQSQLAEVTALRDRMMNLFKSIASGVLTIDREDEVLVCNQTMQDIAGVDGIVGLPVAEALPSAGGVFHDILSEVRETQQQITRDIDYNRNGETRYWTIIASPLRGEHDTQGVAMVIDDMTEQRESEYRLTEARRYLPEALVRNMSTLDLTTIQSEEREITAMFADVRGFTSFSENLEPEELMRVINKYLTIASDSVGLFEGIVDKFMGDAVTGLFNTQLNPQMDHANRAVQAAMQLVLDLHAMHEVLPEDERLFYGIGVHTGEAVMGNVGGMGRKEFSALGDAPDVCKFLQEQAGPGEVIISQATFDMVCNGWECEKLDEHVRVKAGYEDVVCYRVVSRKKGTVTSLIDDELLALLAEDDD